MSSFWVVVRVAVSFCLMFLLDRAFDLLNAPSDLAVVAGLAIVLGEIFFLIWWFKKHFLNKPEEGKGDSMNTKTLLALLFCASLVSTQGCYTVVEPGHAGIKVNLSGGERGVSQFPVVTGRVFYNPINSTVLEYPTFVQTTVWTKDSTEGNRNNEEISFNSKDGIVFLADISLSYQISADSVPDFYVKFRSDDISKFTHGFLRNVARDAFTEIGPQYTTEEIYGTKMGELVNRVRDRINSVVSPFGVHIEQFGFIGAPRPPKNIVDALNAKVQAIQDADKAVNKLQQTEAEARMAVAKAEGEAKANQALSSSLSTPLLEWRRLQIQEESIAKWNGQLPQFSGGSMIPMIQLPTSTTPSK